MVNVSFVGVNDFSEFANEVLTIPSTAAVNTAVCLNITVTADTIVENNETFLSNPPATFSSTMHISPLAPSVMLICTAWIETAAPKVERKW